MNFVAHYLSVGLGGVTGVRISVVAPLGKFHFGFFSENKRNRDYMATSLKEAIVMEIERERVKIISEGTCEYGFRAPVFCVVIEGGCPRDVAGRLCVFE